MTTFSTSAHPPSVAIAWATKTELFVSIPCRDAPPYVCRYPLTPDGLASALNILVEYPTVHSSTNSFDQTAKPHPKVRRPNVKFTDSHRDAAAEVLRKLKII